MRRVVPGGIVRIARGHDRVGAPETAVIHLH
jgi:hypothetical protein